MVNDSEKRITGMALGITWLYQGIVPKLLFPESGELMMVERSGLFAGFEPVVVTIIGLFEIFFGMLFLFSRSYLLHYFNIGALILLGSSAVFLKAGMLKEPFNPLVISIPMIALSLLALRKVNR